MKVNAASPEEAVQLAGSVPLSPAKEALQTESRPGRTGVLPQAARPSSWTRGTKSQQKKQSLVAGGSHWWLTQRQAPSAAGVLETSDEDLGCGNVYGETGHPSWHSGE